MPSKYKPPFVHPYIPNSAPDTFQSMLDAIGVEEIDQLFEAIPEHLRSGHKRLPLPEPYLAEADLWKHVRGMLKKNRHTERSAFEYLLREAMRGLDVATAR